MTHPDGTRDCLDKHFIRCVIKPGVCHPKERQVTGKIPVCPEEKIPIGIRSKPLVRFDLRQKRLSLIGVISMTWPSCMDGLKTGNVTGRKRDEDPKDHKSVRCARSQPIRYPNFKCQTHVTNTPNKMPQQPPQTVGSNTSLDRRDGGMKAGLKIVALV